MRVVESSGAPSGNELDILEILLGFSFGVLVVEGYPFVVCEPVRDVVCFAADGDLVGG